MIKTTLAVAALALVATSGLASAQTMNSARDSHARQVDAWHSGNLRNSNSFNSYNSYAHSRNQIAPPNSLAGRQFRNLPTNNLND